MEEEKKQEGLDNSNNSSESSPNIGQNNQNNSQPQTENQNQPTSNSDNQNPQTPPAQPTQTPESSSNLEQAAAENTQPAEKQPEPVQTTIPEEKPNITPLEPKPEEQPTSSQPSENIKTEDPILGDHVTSETKEEPKTNEIDQISETANTSEDDEEIGQSTSRSIFRTIAIIIIVLIALWLINKDATPAEENQNTNENSNENVNIIIDDTKQDGEVIIIDQEGEGDEEPAAQEDKVKIIAYYGKSGINDCSLVYPVEREIERKYEAEIVNTVRGLLFALPQDKINEGYTTQIPQGTYLKNVTVKNNIAIVDLSANLNTLAGSCAVTMARAQIEKTLLQFSYINQVKICVESNCDQDQILQP